MCSIVSLARVSFAAALLMLAPALHAQQRTAATQAIRGKLVITGDQGTMFNIGAGGAARYRAHLAVATRVLDILKRDAGLAAPIGYDTHLWRIAGPNDPPLGRYFPSHSGINGVLLDYYDDARAVATNGVDISDEGPGFTVLVNDPSCAIGSEIISDEQGPITTAVPRGHAYRGYPSYGDGGLCILVTTITRPLTVPVSQERWLLAQIRHRRAVLDSVHQQDRAYAAEALDSSATATSQQAAADYREWLAEAPDREAQRNSMLDMMRRTMTPAQIEEMRRRFKSSDSLQVATYKRLMASASDSQAQAFRHALSTGVQAVDADTTALHDVHLLEAELARMSPAARRAPAYIDVRSTTPSHLVDRTAPGAVALVTPNRAFLDASRPESAPQVITVEVDCRKVDGQAVGRGCGDGDWAAVNDYERILANLDWAALKAMVAGVR